ncbi:MAG: hypothetical protein VXW65_03855 [Pseudomonadota bacterium]|nr:hypothetical protein [Pseudomonadota bacterium]
MPKIQIQMLDLGGSATRITLDGQAINVRHSAIINNRRVAKTVRGFVISVSVTASVKKMIADAIQKEARMQTRGLTA